MDDILSLKETSKKNLKDLIEILLSPEYLVKKRVLDVAVTGKEFKTYVKSFFEVFNSLDTPKIQTLFEATAKEQFSILIEKGMEVYRELLSEFTDFTSTQFNQTISEVHLRAMNKTLLWFDAQRKMGSKENVKKFRSVFVKEIEKYFDQWMKYLIEIKNLHCLLNEKTRDLKEMEKKLNAAEKKALDLDTKIGQIYDKNREMFLLMLKRMEDEGIEQRRFNIERRAKNNRQTTKASEFEPQRER